MSLTRQFKNTQVNLLPCCFVSLGQTSDCEMVSDKPSNKETKTSSSNRPFDIENLFSLDDKAKKEQKTTSKLFAVSSSRPSFTNMDPAAVTVNGKYAP